MKIAPNHSPSPRVKRCLNKERKSEWSIATWIPKSLESISPPLHANFTRRHVTDLPAGFVADPFLFRLSGKWWLFAEVWDLSVDRGVIGLASSDDGIRWTYERTIIQEPFHLSYPFFFEHEGQHYLMPESAASGEQQIYRASSFPFEWERLEPIIHQPLYDATLVGVGNRMWLLAVVRQKQKDALYAWHADSLFSEWQRFGDGPILDSPPKCCRPGGRPIRLNGQLWLPLQDSRVRYGHSLRLRSIEFDEHRSIRLSTEDQPLLKPGRFLGWNSHGVHHIDISCDETETALVATDGQRRSRWHPTLGV